MAVPVYGELVPLVGVVNTSVLPFGQVRWFKWSAFYQVMVETGYAEIYDPTEPGAVISMPVTGAVLTYAALPTTGLTPGAVYMVQETGRLYIWSGTAWPASGNGIPITGTPGAPGRHVTDIDVTGNDLVFTMSGDETFTATVPALVAATAAKNAAETAAAQAQSWAQSISDVAEDAAQVAADRVAVDTAKTAAQGSATAAAGSATTAQSAATAAGTSATGAAGSATAAGNSATAAAGSATTANTKAGEAATSATTAQGHATTATTKAGEAATSATSASGSASTATTKATEASTSATAAAGSATTASTKAGEASTSATSAASSATTATTKAGEAATSASDAAAAATTATTKAGEASTSAGTASTAASTATTKAGEAADSATAAAASADEAANYVGGVADNAISTVKLQNGAVTSPKIAADAVTNTHIAAGSLQQDRLQPTGAFADALAARELTANRGAVNGYAPLDASGLVPAVNLPSYVDDVLEYANLAGFPGTGTTGKIYVALDTGKIYRWSGSAYVEISPSPGSTDSVTEGSSNLYFTNARAQSALASSLALKAPLASPVFTGTAETPALKVTGGSPGAGKLLTSDASGNATWQSPVSTAQPYSEAYVAGSTVVTASNGTAVQSGLTSVVTDAAHTFATDGFTVPAGAYLVTVEAVWNATATANRFPAIYDGSVFRRLNGPAANETEGLTQAYTVMLNLSASTKLGIGFLVATTTSAARTLAAGNGSRIMIRKLL